MISSSWSWRRLRAGRSKQRQQQQEQDDDYCSGGLLELTTPHHFRCPISLDLMKDPVTLSTGITYDRLNIETWLEKGNTTCPVTNQELTTFDFDPIPNHTIRRMIQDWCVQNRSFGIDRIPTPKIPVTSSDASEILSKLILGYKRRDGYTCRDLVGRIRRSAKESERNKRCFMSTEVKAVLTAVFEAFADDDWTDENVGLLEDVLSALSLMLDGGAANSISHLGSQASFSCMVRLLTCGHFSARTNAVLVLKDVLSTDQAKLEAFLVIEGAVEALFQLIKEPICPAATKASLMIIFYMISASPSATSNLVDMGLVPVIIEGLVESEKSTSEKALGVLDALCRTARGREMIRNHELGIPVLVKKMFRVSDLATEFSVSIIWKLSKSGKENEEKILVEALQVGAFQKLLLLLQVGCAERTKEKATEILKILNIHRNKLREC
ncbi:unnamed protein product [Rhodiola kirilowii]